ncbi:hypothetical protein M422DRAFT_248777 [Sphaerobolus stellatus SS14]|nr:hypothetical protein M422DRAFT_248777 [Sphaerobolus stellatus SS14]
MLITGKVGTTGSKADRSDGTTTTTTSIGRHTKTAGPARTTLTLHHQRNCSFHPTPIPPMQHGASISHDIPIYVHSDASLPLRVCRLLCTSNSSFSVCTSYALRTIHLYVLSLLQTDQPHLIIHLAISAFTPQPLFFQSDILRAKTLRSCRLRYTDRNDPLALA